MSGVFMDGGGNDHMGHGVQAGHGGDGFQADGNFMDGGGHDHGGHGMHGNQGGGEGFLSSILGYNNHNGHHGFLSHLLGLDHDGGHHGHGHTGTGHGAQAGQAPSQTPIWTMALQGMKMSTVFEGVKITPNLAFGLMFLGFTLWLGVVYFIRHHEPFANAVLGSGSARSSTSLADRRIMRGASEAIPIRTQAHNFYVPLPEGSGIDSSGAVPLIQQQPAQPIVPTLVPTNPATSLGPIWVPPEAPPESAAEADAEPSETPTATASMPNAAAASQISPMSSIASTAAPNYFNLPQTNQVAPMSPSPMVNGGYGVGANGRLKMFVNR